MMTGTSLVKHEYECDSYSQDVTPQEQVLYGATQFSVFTRNLKCCETYQLAIDDL